MHDTTGLSMIQLFTMQFQSLNPVSQPSQTQTVMAATLSLSLFHRLRLSLVFLVHAQRDHLASPS